MGFMKEAVGRGKDMALSAALKGLSERYVSRYGRLERIEIDSSRRSLEADILLHGETEPVTLSIDRFDIVHDGTHHLLVAHGIRASRAWIESLARDYLEARTLKIPSPIAHALTMLL